MAAEEQRAQESAQVQKEEAFKKEAHSCALTSGEAAEAKAGEWRCWECKSTGSSLSLLRCSLCVRVQLFQCAYRSYPSHAHVYISPSQDLPSSIFSLPNAGN